MITRPLGHAMPPRRPKIEALVEVAETLFKIQGFRRVSIEEVCRQAGVSKVTFYKHFPHRMALVITVLERMVQQQMPLFEEVLYGPEPYLKRLHMLLDYKRQGAQLMGPALVADLMNPEPELLAWIRSHQQRHTGAVLAFFAEGQQAGVLNPRLTPEFFLYALQQIQTVAQDPILEQLYPDPLARAGLINEFFLFGLMTPPEGHP